LEIRFDCVQCGKCCHDLRLPLSVEEALVWARRGHQVDVLSEASPAAIAVDATDVRGHYRRARSFDAICGSLPLRVHVTLVAKHSGPCPHLRPDMLCGNYELRPRACRIYPAEIIPDIEVSPGAKVCPPEAWGDAQPVLMLGRTVASADMRRLIEEHRAATLSDVDAKAAACRYLGIDVAALANEGYAVRSPRPADFVAAFEAALRIQDDVRPLPWTLASNRRETLDMIEDAGGASEGRPDGGNYIGFFADSL